MILFRGKCFRVTKIKKFDRVIELLMRKNIQLRII